MSTDHNSDTNDVSDVDEDRLDELAEADRDDLSDEEVTAKLKNSLKRRYDMPWVTVFEFENREGRRADCLALCCAGSRNYKLVGFEFKASRSDWLREKNDPEKADLFVQQCDEWYVVAGRTGIVDESELPEGWGLLELKPSERLYKIVESDLSSPQDRSLDREFWARFLRTAVGEQSNFTYDDMVEAMSRARQEGKEQARSSYRAQRLDDKAETVERLENSRLSVLHPIDEDRLDRLARAEDLLELLDTDKYESFENALTQMVSDVERRVETLEEARDDALEHLDALRDALPDEDGETDG